MEMDNLIRYNKLKWKGWIHAKQVFRHLKSSSCCIKIRWNLCLLLLWKKRRPTHVWPL